MSYNGWTNYETWCVHLWLSNDEGSYHAAREAARYGESALRDMVHESIPDGVHGTLWGDMLTSALEAVDWAEVCEAFAPEEDDDDDEAKESNG